MLLLPPPTIIAASRPISALIAQSAMAHLVFVTLLDNKVHFSCTASATTFFLTSNKFDYVDDVLNCFSLLLSVHKVAIIGALTLFQLSMLCVLCAPQLWRSWTPLPAARAGDVLFQLGWTDRCLRTAAEIINSEFLSVLGFVGC